MSDSDNDSDNFYDAEEAPYTPDKICRSKANFTEDNENAVKKELSEAMAIFINTSTELKSDDGSNQEEKLKEAQRMVLESEMRRRKMEEKLRLLAEDEEMPMGGGRSETSSLASSSLSTTFPSSLVAMNSGHANTDDKQSVLSLGKVGALLGGKEGLSLEFSHPPAASSPPNTPRGTIVEPDLVASTKGDAMTLSSPPPIAPPRRKNKTKKSAPPSSLSCNTLEDPASPIVSTPASEMVENLTKELDQSLDLESALRGQYVVKPQDREQDHANYPVTSLSSSQPLHRRQSGSAQSSGGSHKSGSSSSDAHASYRTPEGSTTRSPPAHPGSMKMRSDSGRVLTDMEILEKVQVRNLDTGELIPLSEAEDRLPQCINPLSLHIMRLTSEYVSNPELDKSRDSDEESTSSKRSGHMINAIDGKRVWYQTKKFPKLIGRKLGETVGFIKSKAESKRGHEDLEGPPLDEEIPPDLQFQAKTKASSSHKGPYEFDAVRIVQELEGEHVGAVWTMKFSSCGCLLATAGQDRILRIWVLNSAYSTFHEMRQQYNSEGGKVSPSPSQESLEIVNETEGQGDVKSEDSSAIKGPFRSKPFCVYKGHTADLLDVSWSKNHFILSSSMDKTVRLWHISRKECLCCFQHIDFVTAIAFHPRDDRYFLSGSLDGKLRLWNIPDKKVALWNELEDGHSKLITAVSFCGHGKYAVVGSYDGRCVFYNTEQLKYFTQIHVRSSRGKNAQGRKITSIEPMPGDDKFLVTSNDSRIRLYDIRDLSLSCKYKGYVNTSSQIKASFSHDGKYIISGSENQFIYIWRTSHDLAKLPTVHRRDRNDFWESIKAHDALVTSAVFAPNPHLVLQNIDFAHQDSGHYVILSADFNGCIKVMVNHCTVTSPTGLQPTPALSQH